MKFAALEAISGLGLLVFPIIFFLARLGKKYWSFSKYIQSTQYMLT